MERSVSSHVHSPFSDRAVSFFTCTLSLFRWSGQSLHMYTPFCDGAVSFFTCTFSLFRWSGRFLHMCAPPFQMERSVSSCVCSPFSDGAVIDGDNPEHIRWIFAKSTARADEHGICGVTYRLTQGAYHMSDCVAWLFFSVLFPFFSGCLGSLFVVLSLGQLHFVTFFFISVCKCTHTCIYICVYVYIIHSKNSSHFCVFM